MAALALVVAGGPALAETPPLDWLGGQGCTWGATLEGAATAAGVDLAAMAAAVRDGLADGTAAAQGDWVVFDETACTIRLPEITSDTFVTSPRIAVLVSAPGEYADLGEPGCYLRDAWQAFRTDGDPDADNARHLQFLAASVIAGDLRFYGTDPLRTPVGFRVMVGACADVPDREALDDTHRLIAEGFGAYVRRRGQVSRCGEDAGAAGMAIATELQLQELGLPRNDDQPINAWMGLEFDLITLAAGWYEGMSANNRGTPRPPLCHYAE